MKKKSKYILILFLILYVIMIFFAYKEVSDTFTNIDYIQRFNEYCMDLSEDDRNTYCNLDTNDLYSTADKLTIFYSLMQSEVLYNLHIIAPIILIVFSLYSINNFFKSKYLYYYIQRKNYKSFLLKIFLESYKYVLIVPLFIGVIYLLSSTISNHNSTLLTSLFHTSTFASIHYQTKFFIILYTLNIMLNWLTIINIGLIIQSRNRKYIFNIIEFIIIYFFLEMVIENLPNNWWLFGVYNLASISIYSYIFAYSIYFIISFIVMIYVYKDKENILKRIGD